MEDGNQLFSLAALAGLDVAAVEEVRFERIPQGLYQFEVKKAEIGDKTNNDNEARIVTEIELEIIGVISVLDTKDEHGKVIDSEAKEKLIGKKLTEKNFINPSKPDEEKMAAIGRLRALVTDMGGTWGSNIIENVENLKGSRFNGRIKHQKDRVDETRVFSRLTAERAS